MPILRPANRANTHSIPKFAFIITLAILVSRWADAKDYSEREFGAYMHHSFNMRSSPFALKSVVSNVIYNFEIGWIEPIATSPKSRLYRTYMNPTFNLNASPYSSFYSALFNLKFTRWGIFGFGYKRLLFHGTMVAFENEPKPHQWKPETSFDRIATEWEPGGADIFVFRLKLNFTFKIFNLRIEGLSERWDVDASGLDYIFLFDRDILIQAQDYIHLANISLNIFPDHFHCPTFGTEWVRSSRLDIEKNLIFAGMRHIPLNKRKDITIDFLFGYWSHHPHLNSDEIISSFMLKAMFNWDITLVGQ